MCCCSSGGAPLLECKNRESGVGGRESGLASRDPAPDRTRHATPDPRLPLYFLLPPQRLHRIHTRCAAGGDVTRKQRDGGEQHWDADKGRHVGGCNTE